MSFTTTRQQQQLPQTIPFQSHNKAITTTTFQTNTANLSLHPPNHPTRAQIQTEINHPQITGSSFINS
jgi:hypothetical protein